MITEAAIESRMNRIPKDGDLEPESDQPADVTSLLGQGTLRLEDYLLRNWMQSIEYAVEDIPQEFTAISDIQQYMDVREIRMGVDFSVIRSVFHITVFSSVVCTVMLLDFAAWLFVGHSFIPEIITVPTALASGGTALCGLLGMRHLNRE